MVPCSVDGCKEKKQARGLCMRHYRQHARSGVLPPVVQRQELPPVSISVEDRSYLAGLFDGEGTVCIIRMKGPTKRRPTTKYELHVGVVMTHAAGVQTFLDFFGGHNLALDRRRQKTKYAWLVASRLALRCLKTLEPFLRVKRQHVRIAVEFMDTFRVENIGRNPVDHATLSERERLAEEMSALNDSHWRQKRLAATPPVPPSGGTKTP